MTRDVSNTIQQGVVVEERLDTRNTAIKFFLDQTLAATVNITMLLGGITAMKGGNLTECVAAVRDVSCSTIYNKLRFGTFIS